MPKSKGCFFVQKAIFSSKSFLMPAEDFLVAQFHKCIADLIDHERVQKMDDFTQHLQTSRLQHSINVAYYAFRLCHLLGWDYKGAARAGLLHDLYFYDWRTDTKRKSSHVSWHPRVALDNAKKITTLSKSEEDAILKHMWPCTPVPPKYKISYAVTLADKFCAALEFAERFCNRFGKEELPVVVEVIAPKTLA